MENWAEITEGLAGPMARKLWLHYEMDLAPQPSPRWVGPGEGYQQHPFGDLNERLFFDHWQRLITHE
jgi:hypothetical protein